MNSGLSTTVEEFALANDDHFISALSNHLQQTQNFILNSDLN